MTKNQVLREYVARRVSQCDPRALKLSEYENNLQQFFGQMNYYFIRQELFQGRRYTSKDKVQAFLTQLDHDYYTEAIVDILIDICQRFGMSRKGTCSYISMWQLLSGLNT